jgi:putative ABC transport system permease protein
MSAGLTRQALRRHRWSFLGPVTTQAVAAMVISSMVMTRTSLDAAPLDAAQRQALAATDITSATEVFVGISIYMSILMVGVTMSSAIARQGRDIALLRAVGATPGQVRRSVARQAAIVAVPASILGYLLGVVAGWLWVGALIDHSVLPPAVGFVPDPGVLPLVVGIAVATSVVGGLVAAIRPARVRPATGLTETATGRPHGTTARALVGLVLLAAGVVLSAVLFSVSPEQADDSGFVVMLAMCIGVGLLGPILLRGAARLARPVLRLAGGSGLLATDNLAARSRALSGALIPLVLAIAFAAVKLVSHTTATHLTNSAEPAEAAWLDYSGTTIYATFAAIAALNTLITVAVGRRREFAMTQLAGATRGRVLGVVVCEAVIVVVIALVLAAVVAAVTLLPLLYANLGTWVPYLPAPYLVAGVLATAAVVAAGTVAPAAVLTRRPAIEEASATG